MDKQELQRRIDAGELATTNGLILRTVNILAGKNIKLRTLQYALPDTSRGEIDKSLFYLGDQGYLKARNAYSKQDTDLSEDVDYDDVEVRLTAKGMQLLNGYISDPAVRV